MEKKAAAPSAQPQGAKDTQAGELETLRASLKLLETDIRILSHHYIRLQAENKMLTDRLEQQSGEIGRLTLALAGKAPAPAVAAKPAPVAVPTSVPAPGPAAQLPAAAPVAAPATAAAPMTAPAPAPAPVKPRPSGDGIFAIFMSKKARERKRMRRLAGLCQQAGLFDPAWYLAQHPDVAAAGIEPGVHFIKFGVAERRKPHPDFNWTLHEGKLLALLQE